MSSRINYTQQADHLAPPPDSLRAAATGVVDGAINPDQDIHEFLQDLRLDELVTLAQSKHALHTMKRHSSFPASFYIPLFRYINYLYETWSNIFLLTVKFELPVTDWFTTIFFALLTSFVLFGALIWCQFATNPYISATYQKWSENNAHGLGLVNAWNPKLFNALTAPQIKEAKNKLGLPIKTSVDSKDVRVFDLDIAKLLLQLASVAYERKPDAIHSTMEAVRRGTLSLPSTRHHMSASATSARRMTIHRPATGTGPVDQPSPETSHTPRSPGGSLLLESLPGKLVRDIFSDVIAADIEDNFKEANRGHGIDVIKEFCGKIGLEYEPVSELNNSSVANCSFFWDASSNYIIVCFKGTGPTDYADWVTDLTVSLEDAQDFLPGYGRAIKGFKERIYPTEVSNLGATRPWDTIRYALCKVSEKLARARADEGRPGKINVWFTGHSLGCALATLAYTRAVNTPSDFAGYPISLRDAYLFAAPVTADRPSAIKFNQDLAKKRHVRTMWRVRNAGDAVATLLPQLGDRSDLADKLTPTNPVAYAHFGAEIVMKDYPHLCHIVSPSSHFGGKPSDYDATPEPIRVSIRSSFTRGELLRARLAVAREKGELEREKFFVWLESIHSSADSLHMTLCCIGISLIVLRWHRASGLHRSITLAIGLSI